MRTVYKTLRECDFALIGRKCARRLLRSQLSGAVRYI